jgi:catechol 2,3-dioxygenase-like lactoylglutathione lyase family enzyme
MLSNKQPVATVAVRDLDAARRFYEDKVGLTAPKEEEGPALNYPCGAFSLLVYKSDYAGTNKATSVTWIVGDEIGDIVRKLASKGVAFEHYDMPDVVREGDVHVFGPIKSAWFKDPDGNIHALVNG